MIVTSPNYPDFYPPELYCTSVIRFLQGQRISLEFTDFDVEYNLGDDKCGDWLEIRDGNLSNSPLIGQRLCGEQTPNSIVSSGNTLHLYFQTDFAFETGSNHGFKVKADIGKIVN